MRDARLALANAIKSNAPEARIDQLSNKTGTLAAQLTAIRAKSFEKFYSILTPDQQTRLNGAVDRFFSGHAAKPAA
jgi:Spy/CpxP family protein refolding chaperone